MKELFGEGHGVPEAKKWIARYEEELEGLQDNMSKASGVSKTRLKLYWEMAEDLFKDGDDIWPEAKWGQKSIRDKIRMISILAQAFELEREPQWRTLPDDAHPFDVLLDRPSHMFLYELLNQHRPEFKEVLRRGNLIADAPGTPPGWVDPTTVAMLTSFDYFGRESFRLPEGLWRAFLRTDLRRTASEIGWAYPTVYLDLEGHPLVRGAFLSQRPPTNEEDGYERQDVWLIKHNNEAYPRYLQSGDYHGEVITLWDIPISDWVEMLVDDGLDHEEAVSIAPYEQCADQVWYLGLNLMLYLSNPSVAPVTKLSSLEERRAAESALFQRYIRNGKKRGARDIRKIAAVRQTDVWGHRDTLERRSRWGSSGGSGVGGSSPQSHWVRGHWHKYWVGKRGEQTLTTKWVEPYPKGEEDPVTVPEATTYNVRVEEQ
jgi:hypothetical protein